MDGVPKWRKVSKLCNLSPFETRHESEDQMESALQMVQSRVGALSEKESHEALVTMVSTDAAACEMACSGLFYSILTAPDVSHAQKSLRDLSLITNDAWFKTLCNVNLILIELFAKLRDDVRDNLYWFFKEAIRINPPKLDNVLVNLIRDIHTGADVAARARIAASVLSLLDANREWIKSIKPNSSLPPVALTVFLRLVVDHAPMESLRQREAAFCVWLLREKPLDCLLLGRDLVLNLLPVARLPEFERVWRAMLHSPETLAADFPQIGDLLLRRSSPVLHLRLSLKLQKKLEFLVNEVKFNRHERHCDWLLKEHLASAESGGLRADMVRYICVMLGAAGIPRENVQRWFLLTSLLPNTLTPIESQNCKLTLFWDWLCFDPSNVQPQCLEPAFSLMMASLKVQPTIPITLLDFLCVQSFELYPPLEKQIRSSLLSAFRCIVDSNMAPTMLNLFESPRLERTLKSKLRATFPEIYPACSSSPVTAAPPPPPPPPPPQVTADGSEESGSAEFSDDDQEGLVIDDEQTDVRTRSQLRPKRRPVAAAAAVASASPSTSDYHSLGDEAEAAARDGVPDVNFAVAVRDVNEAFAAPLADLRDNADAEDEERGEMVQALLDAILKEEDLFDDDQASAIADCLCAVLADNLKRTEFLPQSPSEESVDESVEAPVFTLFRSLSDSQQGEVGRQPLLLLVAELANRCEKIGYLLLYFLRATSHKEVDYQSSVYRDFCAVMDERVIDRLVKDMTSCQFDDSRLFGYLVPFLYTKFHAEAEHSVELLHLVVSVIDSTQLLDIICDITEENFSLFRKDTFHTFLYASLEWETIEQYYFWQLVAAESVPTDWILAVIPKLRYPQCAEAMSSVLLMLSRMEKEPTTALLRVLLVRDASKPDDPFTKNALRILIEDKEWMGRVAGIIEKLIGRAVLEESQHASKARGRAPVAKQLLSLDLIFGHLDNFRRTCFNKRSLTAEQFFKRPEVQAAFTGARKLEEFRVRYNELFAVVEILADGAETGRARARRKPPKPQMGDDDRIEAEDDSD